MNQAEDSSPKSCPLCGGEAHFVFSAGDRFYAVTDYLADVFRCRQCASCFQWPIPDRDQLADFYPSGYWGESGSTGLMGRLQAAYVNFMLNLDPMAWIKRLNLPRGAKLVDVGCSRGDWLAQIRATGLSVAGVEADPRVAAYARDHFLLDIEESDADSWKPQPDAWHAITFFHLLEHVRDPGAFLQTCARGLRSDGKLLCRVPNIGSWQAKWTGRRWKGLEMPRHIHLFNPKSLNKLFSDSGFRIISQSTWSWRDGPPALTSSLFPSGEPTRQAILGHSKPLQSLAYLGLNGLVTPIEGIAALFGRGGMITVIAEPTYRSDPSHPEE